MLSFHFIFSTRPPPTKRKKPPIAAKPKMLPQCKAIYDYDANDTDELTFKEGDTIELVKKGKGLYYIEAILHTVLKELYSTQCAWRLESIPNLLLFL